MADTDKSPLVSEERIDYGGLSADGVDISLPMMPKISDMESCDRPYERAEKYGVSSLSDADLLAIILRSGTPQVPVTSMCRSIMKRCGGKFRTLSQLDIDQLTKFKGVGRIKAMQLLAVMEIVGRFNREAVADSPVINTSDMAARLMMPIIGNDAVEHIYIICLSQSLRLIKVAEISRGSAVASVFDVKAAIRYALNADAQAVMLCHNHPSGQMIPSAQDDGITRQFKEACKLMNIRMLDHIIVGGGTNENPLCYSYHDNGKL